MSFEKGSHIGLPKLYAALPECCSCLLLFQRRLLARFREESLGGVFHSDGHSVVNRQNKKPIHRNSKTAKVLLLLSF